MLRSRLDRARRFVAVALLAGSLAACGSSDDEPSSATAPAADPVPGGTAEPSPSSTQPEAPPTTAPSIRTEIIDVVGGVVTGGARTIEADVGEVLRLVVRSDVADEVHLHGYDIRADVAPGSEGVIEFTANIPGIFEIELHDSRRPIGELEVR